MALASTAATSAAANAVTALCGYTDICTASPGTTGLNAVNPTARTATTWATATTGAPNPSNTNALTYALPASTTVTHIGGWNSASNGGSNVYGMGFPLGSSITSGASAGSVTIAIGALSLTAT